MASSNLLNIWLNTRDLFSLQVITAEAKLKMKQKMQAKADTTS